MNHPLAGAAYLCTWKERKERNLHLGSAHRAEEGESMVPDPSLALICASIALCAIMQCSSQTEFGNSLQGQMYKPGKVCNVPLPHKKTIDGYPHPFATSENLARSKLPTGLINRITRNYICQPRLHDDGYEHRESHMDNTWTLG
jgi:hypothetical protein